MWTSGPKHRQFYIKSVIPGCESGLSHRSNSFHACRGGIVRDIDGVPCTRYSQARTSSIPGPQPTQSISNPPYTGAPMRNGFPNNSIRYDPYAPPRVPQPPTGASSSSVSKPSKFPSQFIQIFHRKMW